MSLFFQFAYLQILDLMTTVAFLLNGGKEANPFIRFVVGVAPNPIAGLVVMKVLALGLALYCVRRAKTQLLTRVNVFFACLVVWNLVVLIISARGIAG
ncbi:MAG: hypothetical protein HY233_03945 [Acidobacteriales bacterium]|nr:hypothetical protein [Terriglobales bacterium]